jgi:glycosyltransferase involved in cell wall biosynthesis
MFNNPFSQQSTVKVPTDCDVVFVADFFVEDLIGGAELTTEALIKSSPFKVFKLKSRDVSMETLESGHQKFWVFGNWAGLNRDLIPTIVANLKYSVLEYDYKFCKWRSPEKHEVAERKPCDCENDIHGKLTSTFYLGAKNLYWMSEKQQSRYLQKFPFLKDVSQVVLSSVFEEDFWVLLRQLKDKSAGALRKGWIVLDSPSWIKGRDAAIHWCVTNEVEYEVVKGLNPSEFLEKLSTAEGLVYLPPGGDTCPRMVIEAKLLGCKLQLNENVEHATEDWFTAADPVETESYLYAARETFWNGIRSAMEWKPTISGYTTVKNCILQSYPWEETINSMLGFCDEVVVLDGGSNDGTWERLQEIAAGNQKIVAKQLIRDWDAKRFGVFDGAQKAEARKLCTKEFCWQMDSDEVLPERDWDKVKAICQNLHPSVDLVCLPVVEYWGSKEKVRLDITPWKWRLSRNRGHITHGIPAPLRMTDSQGNLYAKPGTDGCDYVHALTGDIIPFVGFYTEDAHRARAAALSGNLQALDSYGSWFQAAVDSLPSVRHFSWFDIERKIKTYRNYWQKHWESLYDIRQEDTAENNMFFDKPWSDVTDDEISALAKRLATETGGHVFHTKVDWSRATPHLKVRE